MGELILPNQSHMTIDIIIYKKVFCSNNIFQNKYN